MPIPECSLACVVGASHSMATEFQKRASYEEKVSGTRVPIGSGISCHPLMNLTEVTHHHFHNILLVKSKLHKTPRSKCKELHMNMGMDTRKYGLLGGHF